MISGLFGQRGSFGALGVLAFASTLMVSAGAGADSQVSFKKDVLPVLLENCVECHKPGGKGYETNGLDLESYEGVVKGTKYGPVVVAGDIYGSNLLRAVTGQVNSPIRMPFHRRDLSEHETTQLQRWILQGAKNN